MGGFFFIGLYYYGRHEVAALYFALFCFVLFLPDNRLGTLCTTIVYSQAIHGFISVRVEYIAFYMSGFLFARYVRYLFPKDTPVLYCQGSGNHISGMGSP